MKPYSTFIFDSCAFTPETGKIELHYSLDDEVPFTETILFPTPYPLPPTPSSDGPLFALHVIGGISYYKTFCPKKMEIRSSALSKEQADFWNTVYEKGLGEFFFRNQIDFHDLIHFPTSPNLNLNLNPKPNPPTPPP
ncbi:MAG: hypothetical protein PHS73_02800, partial [Candidatus Peribacteraceae bacterium]|nr:hypothetical protein [Candidatus Peribacteraceae bacterium]